MIVTFITMTRSCDNIQTQLSYLSLEFHPDTEEWSLAGHMIEARYQHTVSTINFEDVRDVCFE